MKVASAALVAVVVLLGAVGCSSGGESRPVTTGATPAPTRSSAAGAGSASPSRTSAAVASPTPPVLPEAAKAHTPEGAAAFVRYWFAVLNFAYQTGDVHLLARLTDSRCALCQGVIDAIEEQVAAGGSYEGGAVHVGETAGALAVNGDYLVDFGFQEDSLLYIDDSGATTSSDPPIEAPVYEARLEWMASSWSLFSIQAAQQ